MEEIGTDELPPGRPRDGQRAPRRAARRRPRRARPARGARPRDGRDARLRRRQRPPVPVHECQAPARQRGHCSRLDPRGRGASSRSRRRRRRASDRARRRARAALGDSIAIDGVCLTVVAHERRDARVRRRARDARPHGARNPRAGSRVNLEPALRAGDPLGGHYVQGHVDGVGAVRSVEPEGDGQPDLVRRAARAPALRRREGLDRRPGHEPDRRRPSTSAASRSR